MPIHTYTSVQTYYEAILNRLNQAQQKITIILFSLDAGEWSDKIADCLMKKSQQGISVRIMVDWSGQKVENVAHVFSNQSLLKRLKQAGMEVHVFNQVWAFRFLHIKLIAIDDWLFWGGSNIADHYTQWQDLNFATQLNTVVHHQLYEILKTRSLSQHTFDNILKPIELYLHLPNSTNDIFPAWLSLVRQAKQSFRFCSWYFFPTPLMIEALVEAVHRGVKVEGMISARNRAMMLTPWTWKSQAYLEQKGVQFYHWQKSFFHTKAYWNDQAESLVGSANFDIFSCFRNIEMLCYVKNHDLTHDLNQQFLFWKKNV